MWADSIIFCPLMLEIHPHPLLGVLLENFRTLNLGQVHCGVRFSESRYIDCNYSLLNTFIIMIDYMRYIRISRVAGE